MSKLESHFHDEVHALRFGIVGHLSGSGAGSLDQTWRSAKSVPNDRKVIIDLASLCSADEQGRSLLIAWGWIGARINARSGESRALAEEILGGLVPMLAAKHGWRQRLTGFLLRGAAAASKPAPATKTDTNLLAREAMNR